MTEATVALSVLLKRFDFKLACAAEEAGAYSRPLFGST
jgi:hypothetical protein